MALALILGVASADGAPAQAQNLEDPMDVQRCVWRCLHDSPGADSPQYGACVAARCNDGAQTPPSDQGSRAAPQWFASRTGDGQGNLAGVQDLRNGNSFYVMCDGAGRVHLALFGPEGPDATLTLTVDGTSFQRGFVGHAGGYYAPVGAGSAEVASLLGGQILQIGNAAGTLLIDVWLHGAAPAIGAACPKA